MRHNSRPCIEFPWVPTLNELRLIYMIMPYLRIAEQKNTNFPSNFHQITMHILHPVKSLACMDCSSIGRRYEKMGGDQADICQLQASRILQFGRKSFMKTNPWPSFSNACMQNNMCQGTNKCLLGIIKDGNRALLLCLNFLEDMASHTTSLANRPIVCSTACSGTQWRWYQSSTWLALLERNPLVPYGVS